MSNSPLVTKFEKLVKDLNTIIFGNDDQDVILDDIAKPTISKWLKSIVTDLNEAINIAAAAGAGANGWTDLLIQTWSGRTQADKNKDFVSVKDFGAKGDGVTDDTIAIQEAESYVSSRKIRLYFPAGVYLTSQGIKPKSKTVYYGDGIDSTTIRLINGDNETNACDVFQQDTVLIFDMTIDGNYPNRTDVPTVPFSHGGCALRIKESKNIVAIRVKATNPFAHSIDINGESYHVNYNPEVWSPNPSSNIWLDKCIAEKGRDDNITTHQCHDVWITDCLSINPLGGYVVNNNNCLEIDDGSRNIFVSNFVGIGGYSGVQIKGHATAPAPYNINMTNIRCINNYIGFECRHTSFYGASDGGFSTSARGITVDGLTIISPTISNTWLHDSPSLPPSCALLIRSYDDVNINNVTTYTDNSGDKVGDYQPAQQLGHPPVRIIGGARNVNINNITVNGSNWVKSDELGAVYLGTSDVENINITNVVGNNVGGKLLHATTSTKNVNVFNLTAINDGAALTIYPYVNASSGGSVSGSILTKGYTNSGLLLNQKRIGKDMLPNGIGDGYQDNVTTAGYARFNTNSNQDFGGSLRIASTGNVTYFYNGVQTGLSMVSSGGGASLGVFYPLTTNVYSLGRVDRLWSTVYAGTGTINTSDERLKQQFRSLDAREKACALEIKNSIYMFKFNDAVDLKGDGARWHVGVKAQQVITILENHGLNPFDYGFVCYDEWDAQDEILDKAGNVAQERQEAGSRYAIRYDELAMFILAVL